MESSGNEKGRTNKSVNSTERNLIAFFISFVLASLLWFLQTLEKKYVADLYINANYVNIPENKILRHPLPERYLLKIEANGWDILKLKGNKKKSTITIDLERFGSKKATRILSVKNSFFPEGFLDVKTINVYPDTLTIAFDKAIKKTIKVLPRYKLSFKKYYGLSSSVKVHPGFIEITGPKADVERLDFVYTKIVEARGLDKQTKINVEPDFGTGTNITSNVKNVRMDIIVEPLTEGKLTVDIEIPVSCKDSIHLIPEKVTLTFQAALSIFEDIDKNDFKIYIPQREFYNKNIGMLKLEIDVLNDFVYKVQIEPAFVDFIKIK